MINRGRRVVLGAVVTTASAFATAATVAAATADLDAIRQVQERQAAAYAALLTSDGAIVNVLGWWWQGRSRAKRNREYLH